MRVIAQEREDKNEQLKDQAHFYESRKQKTQEFAKKQDEIIVHKQVEKLIKMDEKKVG